MWVSVFWIRDFNGYGLGYHHIVVTSLIDVDVDHDFNFDFDLRRSCQGLDLRSQWERPWIDLRYPSFELRLGYVRRSSLNQENGCIGYWMGRDTCQLLTHQLLSLNDIPNRRTTLTDIWNLKDYFNKNIRSRTILRGKNKTLGTKYSNNLLFFFLWTSFTISKRLIFGYPSITPFNRVSNFLFWNVVTTA